MMGTAHPPTGVGHTLPEEISLDEIERIHI